MSKEIFDFVSIQLNKNHKTALYVQLYDEIREMMQDDDYLKSVGLTLKDLYFIHEKTHMELAFLPDDSKFNNLNIYEFEIPINDKIFLTKRVLDANKLLNEMSV